jgi:hypothetical protein
VVLEDDVHEGVDERVDDIVAEVEVEHQDLYNNKNKNNSTPIYCH